MNTEEDEDKVVQVLTYGWCAGSHCKGKNPATEGHTCPYSEEINNDHESMCNCCGVCAGECAMDI